MIEVWCVVGSWVLWGLGVRWLGCKAGWVVWGCAWGEVCCWCFLAQGGVALLLGRRGLAGGVGVGVVWWVCLCNFGLVLMGGFFVWWGMVCGGSVFFWGGGGGGWGLGGAWAGFV